MKVEVIDESSYCGAWEDKRSGFAILEARVDWRLLEWLCNFRDLWVEP